ncbi:InlB B-repeat-containing protein [Aurantimicrobium sp. MWH-Uga1]|uniref:InlB B-repeat-containing protein n=1 Tax=Aurantimicrobium sp. MWH-Uga1 TaxID=2079575 RepID=UPI000DEE0352|nr:InlB B-repeat-containing protein [Aurantimicrobium sp. MWH-Uga1]
MLKRNTTALSLTTVFVLLGSSAVHAVSASDLFLNLVASDSGSYDSSTPGTWRDLSSFNRNGTITGSLNYNNATGALEFPNSGASNLGSNSYVDMGSGFNNFGSGITIEFEGHFGATNQAWERIFDFGNGPAADNIWVGVLGESSNPNELAIEIFHGANGKSRCISTNQALLNNGQAGVFAKFVITLDGSKCRMYKNGAEIDTAVGQVSFFNDSNDLGSTYTSLPLNVIRNNNYIGRSNWGTDASFNGAIKYVRIYTAAITSAEAASNAASYTLTYSATGSTSGSAPASRTGNGLITLDGNSGSLAKPGYTFTGWADSANQTNGTTGSYNLIANTTLYPAFAVNTYNVTYIEQGGSAVNDGTFTHGGSLTYPTNPTKTGHSFLGWFAASSGGTARSASDVSAGNASVTLYAQWSANTYNVTYDEHGGSAVNDGSYVYGNTLVFPTAPTRSGYTFAGWFAAATGGTALTASAVSAGTSNVTLHAQWTPLPSQTVTWAPTNTSVLRNLSSVTPSSPATTNGDGQISYSVVDARTTGCSVDSSTGVVSFTGVGICSVRATAASTTNYLADTQDVDFSISSSTPTVSLALDMTTGSNVANSTVDYAASGLQSNSAWTLIVRSNPQTIASGTFSSSLLSGSAQIPAGLSEGWHSITLTGTGSNGEIISHAVWFEVSSSGTLLQTSGIGPVTPTSSAAVLPQTGGNIDSLWMGAVLLLTGATFFLLRRSTASNK